MKIKKSCPQCKSNNVRVIDYLGIKCIICSSCGFDESAQYEVFPEEKKSQKAKGKHNVYKAGGFGRTKKL